MARSAEIPFPAGYRIEVCDPLRRQRPIAVLTAPLDDPASEFDFVAVKGLYVLGGDAGVALTGHELMHRSQALLIDGLLPVPFPTRNCFEVRDPLRRQRPVAVLVAFVVRPTSRAALRTTSKSSSFASGIERI